MEVKNIIDFMELIGRLKHLKRTGWVIKNIPNPETISGHMYRMAMLSFLVDPKDNLNKSKLIEMALVHDLAECIVGDITPHCGVAIEDKHRMEDEAMETICKNLGDRGVEILKLFREYEKQESPEACYVKDLDRIDLLMQAYEYEKRDNNPGLLQYLDGVEVFCFHNVPTVLQQINKSHRVTITSNYLSDDVRIHCGDAKRIDEDG